MPDNGWPFAFDVGNMEFLRFDFGFGIHGLSLGVEVEFFELFAVEGYQVRANQRLGFGNEVNVDRPVFFGFEFFNFVFAVANQTKGDRLNTPADLEPGSLRHSTGESVKPTR